MIAALYVAAGGCYTGLPGVDPWDETRDARRYEGPWPVVAHPPCQRWGRFWHGSTRKPHQFEFGADGGCFAHALATVRLWGGVIEHPADSGAWNAADHPTRPGFGLPRPVRGAGWTARDVYGGASCYVEQGRYGHFSNKGSFLYACHGPLPELDWSRGPQRLDPVALARHGYVKARRIGMVAMIGGKLKTEKRNATPIPFRDVLLAMAAAVW